MKRLFSFLLIFSAFSIVALPFFLNPNFAQADYCDCPTGNVCAGNPPTTEDNCNIECGGGCTWMPGSAPDQCTSGEPNCNFTTCNSNNSGLACCNNFTVSINCGTFCANHPGCSNPIIPPPSCDDSNCSDWCETEDAQATDNCCDDSNPSKEIDCGQYEPIGQACESNQTDCKDFCGDASDANTLCCDSGATEKAIQITCSAYTATVAATGNTKNSGGGSLTPTNGGSAASQSTGKNAVPTNLPNPLGNTNTVPKLVGTLINGALGIVGSLALLMFIYGGFTWMLAAGNEQAVEKGKNILMWAAIGLVVIFASYSLVSFVINSLTGATGS